SVTKDTFMKPELRKQWITKQMNLAKLNFLDGLNFDYESAIKKTETDVRDAYTALVKETNQAFKKEMPHFQVTVDVAWKPNTDLRFYDYVGLAENSDFLFVMAYDERSQIFGECLALPNSGLPQAREGLLLYLKGLRKAISPNKLVLGLPWYGYFYTCIKMDEQEKCEIKQVPFRGVNCSDAAGSQVPYAKIYNRKEINMTKWNGTSATPFFDCITKTGQPCQMQFDNPYSLSLKYKLAREMNLRGVGMWNIDLLDYSDTTEADIMRREMFAALPGESQLNPLRFLRPETTFFDNRATSKPRTAAVCPCSDPKLCEPIKDRNRKEVFAFSNENNETHWQLFDWSKLTTVVMFNYLNTDLMCLAHSHGVRAVVLGAVSELVVITPALRHLWVKNQTQIMQDNFLDGVNFDYEHTILPAMHHYRDAFTALVKETADELRKVQPYAQVSVCTVVDAFSQVMAYDYPALSEAADFLFIMAYDESGTLHNGPNSDYHVTQAGVESFLKQNISADKLVMGLPWYGDVYQCVSLQGDDCVIEPSGKGFGQWSYERIVGVLQTVPDRYRWNSTSLTPYFTYTESKTNISHMVQFDDPRSLALKYQLAAKMNIRGVGMFLIDCLDFSKTAQGQAMRKAMFDPLPSRSRSNNWDVLKSMHQNSEYYGNALSSSEDGDLSPPPLWRPEAGFKITASKAEPVQSVVRAAIGSRTNG
ncbi:Di-n-acetylchitobiase, partial [Plakobranchus ocellatus]